MYKDENIDQMWHIFYKTLFPLFIKNEKDEEIVIRELIKNMDNILKQSKLNVMNTLALNNSFFLLI